MRQYRYLFLDVFTERAFEGNQLAVFPDAGGIDEREMQAIAREINFSETTFVLPRELSGTDVRMRIFTPGAEVPIAGHPTIGSTFALAHLGRIEPGASGFVFGLNAGPTPVELTWRDTRLDFAWMTQPLPAFSSVGIDRAALAAALGLDVDDLVAGLPLELGSSGVPFLYVPLRTRAAVDRADLARAALRACCRDAGQRELELFIFTTESGDDGATAYSRMLGPALGVAEDPATGIASGPLGAYLVRHRLASPDASAPFVSLQGRKMGRPSRVFIAIEARHGTITRARVGGTAVVVAEGAFHLC